MLILGLLLREDEQLPLDCRRRRMLVMVLRRQRVPFRYAYLISTSGAAVDARIRRCASRSMLGIVSLVIRLI